MANQYFTCVLDAWRDGTTLYARMHYYRSGTYFYQDTSFPNPTIDLGGGVVYEDDTLGNAVRSGVYVGDIYGKTVSRTVSGTGSRSVTYTAGSGYRADFQGTWTATVDGFPGVNTQPAAPSVSIRSKTYNSATFNVSLSSYGNPSGASGRYIEAAILAQNSYGNSYRYEIAQNTTSATITVNNSSRTGSTALTIQGNKKYWYGGYATNTALSNSTVTGSFYTPCPPLSALSLSSQTYSTYNKVNAVISYTRQSDGGAETRTGYYRFSTDGGSTWSNWTSFGTVSNTTGTFTATGLPTASSITFQAKLNTPNGGDSEAKTVTFSTQATHTAPNFSNFTYEDASSAAVAVSGNNQVFIQGQSQPKVTISAANKATANDGATITGYTASLNAESIQIAYSSSASVSGTFSANRPTASGTLALSVAANDSLSLAKSVSKNVTVIPWAAPVLNATATRTNNFENNTTIAISGTYSPVKVNNTVKNTLAIAYRSKKSSSSSWSNWTSKTPTINDNAYTVPNFVLSFDNEYQWDIEVRAVDKFATTTTAITLPVGKPIFFISRNKKVSVNRKPTNYNADLDVEGKVYAEDNPLS